MKKEIHSLDIRFIPWLFNQQGRCDIRYFFSEFNKKILQMFSDSIIMNLLSETLFHNTKQNKDNIPFLQQSSQYFITKEESFGHKG